MFWLSWRKRAEDGNASVAGSREGQTATALPRSPRSVAAVSSASTRAGNGGGAKPCSADFMDRLIEAGLEVFGRKGLKRARMSDVAKQMGVSQGTLYNYVESKEALFGLLVEKGVDPEPGGKGKPQYREVLKRQRGWQGQARVSVIEARERRWFVCVRPRSPICPCGRSMTGEFASKVERIEVPNPRARGESAHPGSTMATSSPVSWGAGA